MGTVEFRALAQNIPPPLLAQGRQMAPGFRNPFVPFKVNLKTPVPNHPCAGFDS